MPSGKQLAQENLKKFQAWVSERKSANDWKDYIHRNQLNRAEIARECMFATSVLRQNPAIRDALAELENELVHEGILEPSFDEAAEKAADQRLNLTISRYKKRIKALEEQNSMLKARVAALEETLKRYELLDQHLCETGRIVKP